LALTNLEERVVAEARFQLIRFWKRGNALNATAETAFSPVSASLITLEGTLWAEAWNLLLFPAESRGAATIQYQLPRFGN